MGSGEGTNGSGESRLLGPSSPRNKRFNTEKINLYQFTKVNKDI